MSTPSGIFRTIDAGTRIVLLIFVGLCLMAGGIWLTAYAVQHPPLQKVELYLGVATAIFGALLLPGILGPAVNVSKQVIVIVQQLPIVGPMFGGRRATDPPRSIEEPPKEP